MTGLLRRPDALLCALGVLAWFHQPTDLQAPPPRARDLGVPFDGTPGKLNAITDVAGVEVGHCTLIKGHGDLIIGQGPVRTGVTAILPRGKRYEPVFAATYSLNGNGEMTGAHWVDESGFLEDPILVTNTHSIGAVHEGVIAWRRENGLYPGESPHRWAALPVVAETYDGNLNDLQGFHVRQEHVFLALNSASEGPVVEGNVGGGTGMICYRFKGGIGTASRIVKTGSGGFTVGVLVQANFGARDELMIAGVPVGREIGDLMPKFPKRPPREGGSIIAVVATDAPLLPHQVKRLARRVPVGIGRVGGVSHNSSGDLFIAFSVANAEAGSATAQVTVEMLPNGALTPLFRAVAQATEEAIVNALVAARTMTGINGNTVYNLPHDRLRRLLRRYNRLGK